MYCCLPAAIFSSISPRSDIFLPGPLRTVPSRDDRILPQKTFDRSQITDDLRLEIFKYFILQTKLFLHGIQ